MSTYKTQIGKDEVQITSHRADAEQYIPLHEGDRTHIAKRIESGQSKGEITVNYNRLLYVLEWKVIQ